MLTDCYSSTADVTLYCGDCLDLLSQIKQSGDKAKLILTSPPYNIGKSYETRLPFTEYIENQRKVIQACVDILDDSGSICWQVGTYIEGTSKSKEIYPLDIVLYPIFKELGLILKNRIVWTFGHGLHDQYRFSGRHETILWFVKGDNYTFNLDPVRIPQQYPNKRYYRGSKKGELSCNPLGKNPGDVWDITQVKYNHPEKTSHPCQFPEALAERLILALTNESDLIVDPYIGSCTTAVVSQKLGRRCAGSDIDSSYLEEFMKRTPLHKGLTP